MKTKEISFTLPIIVTLCEFMFFDGKIKRRILCLIPLLLTMFIIPFTLIGMGKPVGELISDMSEATRLQTAMSRWDYLFTQFRVIVTYIRLLFVPLNQNLDYDYSVYHTFSDPNVYLSFLFLLSLFGLGIFLFYRSRTTRNSGGSHNTPYTLHAARLVAFGIFWFFITLSVESSIVPIVDVIFEHRVYLPSVGALIAVTTSVLIIADRLRVASPVMGKAFVAGLVSAVLIFSVATYARNGVWHDEVSLCEDMVSKSPNKARVQNNVGLAYHLNGWVDRAIEHFQIALRLDPYYETAHHNLYVVYMEKGDVENARYHLSFERWQH
jgi:tetratricopeptide (TPR) repeat protein